MKKITQIKMSVIYVALLFCSVLAFSGCGAGSDSGGTESAMKSPTDISDDETNAKMPVPQYPLSIGRPGQ